MQYVIFYSIFGDNFILSALLLYINTKGGFRGGPMGSRPPPLLSGNIFFCKRVLDDTSTFITYIHCL